MDATIYSETDVREVASALQIAGLHALPLNALEHAAILNALEKSGRNRTHAARSLGISVRTLQRKLKRWDGPGSASTHSISHDGDQTVELT